MRVFTIKIQAQTNNPESKLSHSALLASLLEEIYMSIKLEELKPPCKIVNLLHEVLKMKSHFSLTAMGDVLFFFWGSGGCNLIEISYTPKGFCFVRFVLFCYFFN